MKSLKDWLFGPLQKNMCWLSTLEDYPNFVSASFFCCDVFSFYRHSLFFTVSLKNMLFLTHEQLYTVYQNISFYLFIFDSIYSVFLSVILFIFILAFTWELFLKWIPSCLSGTHIFKREALPNCKQVVLLSVWMWVCVRGILTSIHLQHSALHGFGSWGREESTTLLKILKSELHAILSLYPLTHPHPSLFL